MAFPMLVHDIKIPVPGGKPDQYVTVSVKVEADFVGLAQTLGRKAFHNKNRQASDANGLVHATIVGVK